MFAEFQAAIQRQSGLPNNQHFGPQIASKLIYLVLKTQGIWLDMLIMDIWSASHPYRLLLRKTMDLMPGARFLYKYKLVLR